MAVLLRPVGLCLLLAILAAAAPNDDELKFVMLVTRHGARSPTVAMPPNTTMTDDKWDIYLGDLTHSGERQHFLQGTKLRKRYGDIQGFLSPDFDPREFVIMSTDFNRTIMSAYSEIMSYFPLGKVQPLTKDETLHSNPPFPFKGDIDIVKQLGTSPTMYGFQPVPIHVGNIDVMMRGMDTDICKYQAILRHNYQGSDGWIRLNEHYQQLLFPEMSKNWNIDLQTLNFSSAYPYVDNYYSAWFDQMEFPNELTPQAQDEINNILRDGLYDGFYGLDLAIRLATTRFFNFLHSTIERKINVLEGIQQESEFYNHIKYMFLSAHDSTLSAIMSGLKQRQDVQVYFASDFVVEVYRTSGNSTNMLENYSVRMLYNDVPLNIGGKETCPEAVCSFATVKKYLISREYTGDYDITCNPQNTAAKANAWLIVLLVTAILIIVLNAGYFIIRGMKNKRPSGSAKLVDDDSEKGVLNKSIPSSTRMVSDNDSN